MDTIQILYDYKSADDANSKVFTVLQKDLNEKNTAEQVYRISQAIGNMLFSYWPIGFDLEEINNYVKFNLPLNFKISKKWNLLFKTAFNILEIDNEVNKVDFRTTYKYVARPDSTDKFVPYFNIYKHFISNIAETNALFEKFKINEHSKWNDKLVDDLLEYVEVRYPTLLLYKSNVHKQIALAYSKLLVNLGYLEDGECPDITVIDIENKDINAEMESANKNKKQEEEKKTSTEESKVEEIKIETKQEEKKEELLLSVQEKNEILKKEIIENIDQTKVADAITAEIEKEEKAIESVQSVWEETKEVLKEDKVENPNSFSWMKFIISIENIKDHKFDETVKNAVIRMNTALLDNFIYCLEKSKESLNEEALLEIVKYIKPSNISISNKHCLLLLIETLRSMEYEKLLKSKIDNFNYRKRLLPDTLYILDDTVYSQVPIINGYKTKDADSMDCFSTEFVKELNNDTVLKVFSMDHPEIKRISDFIIKNVNRNSHFLGKKKLLTKKSLIEKVYPKMSDAIMYTCKFWIVQFKKSMTPDRLILRVYQLLCSIFKEYISRFEYKFQVFEIRDTLLSYTKNFFNGTPTGGMNKMLDSVCTDGHVKVINFNWNFKLSKTIIMGYDQSVNNKQTIDEEESAIEETNINEEPTEIEEFNNPVEEIEDMCDVEEEIEEPIDEIDEVVIPKITEKSIGLKMAAAYKEMMAKHNRKVG